MLAGTAGQADVFEKYNHKLLEDGHSEENVRYDCCGSNNSQTILTHELTKFNNNFGQEGEICENSMDFVEKGLQDATDKSNSE